MNGESPAADDDTGSFRASASSWATRAGPSRRSGRVKERRRGLLPLREERGDPQQVVREDGGAHEEFKPLGAAPGTALHAATAKEDRDAPLDAGTERLGFLER